MRLATLVSPDDWTFNFGTAGKHGWRYIVERCAQAGITRIYWRVTTGFSYYASKINNTGPIFDEPAIRSATKLGRWWFYEPEDWSKDDTLAAATEWARRRGIELIAWVTLENAHGLGTRTRLAQEHPEMMTVDRCGKRYWRLHGWAFPEVRNWWLNIVREIVAYNPDGILLDLARLGYASEPRTGGVATGGYEKPMVEGFRNKTGRDPFTISNNDPEWVAFRADYFTQWVGNVYDLLSSQPVPMKLSALICAPGTYRIMSPTAQMTDPSERNSQMIPEDLGVGLSGSPLNDRFADIATWASNGWLKRVTLVGNVPKSDLSTWKFVRFEGPPYFRIEPEDKTGGREATNDEISGIKDYFDKLGGGKLGLGWSVNPLTFTKPEELTRRIIELNDQGFEEVNIDESNLLMNVINDRWDAVEKASKEINK
ncbi:MAG: family 10 glycosylhydrolase [Phycisphaerae bacterium]